MGTEQQPWVAGEIVLVTGTFIKGKASTIARVTPSGLAEVSGVMYHPDGRQRGGDSLRHSRIRRPAPEKIAEIREGMEREALGHELSDLLGVLTATATPIDKLRRAVAAVRAFVDEKET